MFRNVMFRKTILGLVAVVVSASSAYGQDFLSEVYGQGVHAYFARRHNEAFSLLSTAINQGSRDPRVYYFRGLSASAMGRQFEAEMDFQQGATLEYEGGRSYPIGQALQRVQGHTRLVVEKQRSAARLTAYMNNASRQRSRYQQQPSTPPSTSPFPPRVSHPTSPSAAPAETPKAPGAEDMGDPFKDDPDAAEQPKPSTPARPTQQPPTAPPSSDPFGEESKPAAPAEPTTPAESDPFGGPAQPATEPAQPTTEPAQPQTPQSEADPFGTPASEPAPSTTEPAPTTPQDDPFADPK